MARGDHQALRAAARRGGDSPVAVRHVPDSIGRLTRLTRRRYDRRAPTFDAIAGPWERLFAARLRRRLWSGVEGARVLEAGLGTGANLPYHPAGERLTAVELSDRMLERARRRAAAIGSRCRVLLADAQALPFQDDSFDAAVATFTFCSIPDPIASLIEIRRVVRPGGMIHLLEQVRVEVPVIGAVMGLADPLVLRPSGAHIARRTVQTVRAAGLRVVQDELHGPFGFVRLIRARVP
ncbi:MAG: class I SAM-dependent methyltransferase [Chloroflexi bacterium]|nr:class I SAM-dependent methyltransferase [Chloroflexota bacterium]